MAKKQRLRHNKTIPKEIRDILSPDSLSWPKAPEPINTKITGDRGMPRKRAKGPKRRKDVNLLWRTLHRQLYRIYGAFVVTPNERAAYIKLWYNGDLKDLRLTCKKIINLCDSIEELKDERFD